MGCEWCEARYGGDCRCGADYMGHIQSLGYYQGSEMGSQVDEDPELCDCQGSGWLLSPMDSWHECREHRGKPHPEVY